jgi:hypothetical protein
VTALSVRAEPAVCNLALQLAQFEASCAKIREGIVRTFVRNRAVKSR